MRREPHPISGAIYEALGDGRVRVEDRDRCGLFTWDGAWIEGELTHADPHMLLYIGGPDLPPGREVPWMMLPPGNDPDKPVLSPQQIEAMARMPRVVAPYVPDPGMATPDGMRSVAHVDTRWFLDNDRKPDRVPEAYRQDSPCPGGPMRVGVDRFFKREYHDLEVERIWKRTWQMACRVDDIPEVGDYHIYEIADLSFLVVRTGPDSFKAHYNACLHRGRILRERDGKAATEFRCPYHGWTWKIDGSLQAMVAQWDFPGVRDEVCTLPGAQVATWGGFVFINPDPEAGPLEDFLGPVMIDQYSRFGFERRHKHAHVTKVVRANWKLVAEAFMEAYHIAATHPQQLLFGGDCINVRYDVFGNFGRAGNLDGGVVSPLRGIVHSPEQALDIYRRRADANREFWRPMLGDEAVERFSDAELNDGTFNSLFPNLNPWGGWGRIVFRFRPNGSNPDESLFDVMLLSPWPEDRPMPPHAAHRQLAPDESWTAAPELGMLAKILDQDLLNLPRVHAGLKTKQPPHVIYSAYQEGLIRNFHQNYDRALGLDQTA